MKLIIKLRNALIKIKYAPDSDDVDNIMRRTVDQLIDAGIMGLELRLCLHHLQMELTQMLFDAKDFIEINNMKRALEFIERVDKVYGTRIYAYERN